MVTRTVSTLWIALVASACASASAGPSSEPADHHVDPAGTYDLVVDMNGMLISATLEITGNVREGWSGTIESDAGPASVARVRVDGHQLVFHVPEAQARVELHVNGKTVEGEMTGGMGAAKITGEKR